MSYEVGSHIRPDCFRSQGPLTFYVYEWMCRGETIYVGRGGSNDNKRYEMFFRSRKYGTPERHEYVFRNKDQLTCRFAVMGVALDVAKEAESLLISYWQSKEKNEPFFNDIAPTLPALNDLGEDRRASASFDVTAIIPPQEACLAWRSSWHAATEIWDDDELVAFTGKESCWKQALRNRRGRDPKPVPGFRFDREVLRRCLPARVGEIVEFAKDFDFTASQVKSKNGHLSWGCDKGYLARSQPPES